MRLIAFALGGLLCLPKLVLACDPCALYSATKVHGLDADSIRVSLAEQYTSYDDGDRGDESSLEGSGTVRSYSTTTLSLGYDLSSRWGVQLSLPIVSRHSKGSAGGERQTGIGDIALFANYLPISERAGTEAVIWSLYAGVKFPTGATESIDRASDDAREEEEEHHKSHTPGGVVGGRTLTLGTGSYDFPIGSSFYLQRNQFFFLAGTQYTFHTEGDFDYQFDNELLVNIGPGIFLAYSHNYSVALRGVLSSELKGLDEQNGGSVEGSKAENWFLGPEFLVTTSLGVSGELGVDFVLDREKSSATLVPEYRVRAAISYSF